MTTKPWYASKTLWVNAVALIGSVVVAFGVNIDTATWATLSSAALAVINIGLRLVTGEPIGEGKEETK